MLTWSDGNALTLRWDEVVTDSRCPTDAVCVWAGEIELRLHVSTGSDSTSLVLRLPEREAVPPLGKVAGFTIRLDRVSPEPSLAAPPTEETYQAHLTVAPPGTLLPSAVTAISDEGWASVKRRVSAESSLHP